MPEYRYDLFADYFQLIMDAPYILTCGKLLKTYFCNL